VPILGTVTRSIKQGLNWGLSLFGYDIRSTVM
jgi:hypothetical protein